MPPLALTESVNRHSDEVSIDRMRPAHGRLERLRYAIDQHSVVAVTDPGGRITYANAKFCELSGYSSEELLGQDHRIVNSGYHPKSFFRDMWRAISDGRVWKGTIRNKAKEGHYYWVATTIVPFADDDGQIVEYMAIRTDITKHWETAHRLAEMKEAAHGFVDHVSHEFRTPLTVIKEFASIIRDELVGPVNEEQREYLGIITGRVDDLASLVDDMLDTSKLDAGLLGVNREDCRIEDVVARVQPTLQRKAAAVGARLEFDLPPGLPSIYCDSEKVGRVLTNFVINALKYGGQPGTVLVSVSVDASANELAVAIADKGPGISPENLDRLFKRFSQVGSQSQQGVKGFGLGLCIAKELVNLNLGDVRVSSQLGDGSTFTFTLPLSDRRTLLGRYLKRVSQVRGGTSRTTIYELTTASDASTDRLEELADEVRRNTRKWDLLFRLSQHRWLLVASMKPGARPQIQERIGVACANAGRGRSEQPLPPLKWAVIGSWNIQTGSAACIDRFVAIAGSQEPARG